MRITTVLASALSLAVTVVEAGLADFAIPAHIKPGDTFTVHIHDATTRFGEDRIYWAVNPVDPSEPYHYKVGMYRRFHETDWESSEVVIPGVWNGTIPGLRLPADLPHGPYTMQAMVVGFQGAMKIPQLATYSLPFDVAGFTDPHGTNDAPNLVWASDNGESRSGCWVPEPGF